METAQLTAAEEADLRVANDVADSLFGSLLDEIPEDVDTIFVAFNLWISLTQVLAGAGWTADELTRDVHHHVALATAEGGMN